MNGLEKLDDIIDKYPILDNIFEKNTLLRNKLDDMGFTKAPWTIS